MQIIWARAEFAPTATEPAIGGRTPLPPAGRHYGRGLRRDRLRSGVPDPSIGTPASQRRRQEMRCKTHHRLRLRAVTRMLDQPHCERAAVLQPRLDMFICSGKGEPWHMRPEQAYYSLRQETRLMRSSGHTTFSGRPQSPCGTRGLTWWGCEPWRQ